VYGTSGTKADLWSYNVKTNELRQLGSAAVATQEYIASIEADPTGRYLYYVPGAHGGASKDGTPVVQYDVTTGKKKVLAFLHDLFWDKYGYASTAHSAMPWTRKVSGSSSRGTVGAKVSRAVGNRPP